MSVDKDYKKNLFELKKALKGNFNKVAKKSNVSLTYVGMVLSGDAVNGESVEKVLAAAREIRTEIEKQKQERQERLNNLVSK